MSTTEVTPDPKPGATAKQTPKRSSRSGSKSKTASKSKTTSAARGSATQPKQRTPEPGMPTKRPANLAKSQHQPPKGQKVTDGMVKKAREEWGIEPIIDAARVVAIKPGSRGHIVHAATAANATHTLCRTETNWVGGSVSGTDAGEINCLWCKTRIK